ncbi:protein THEM6 [Anopheles aquasalis]|uniref:protein THEM6 n=1 Tax=Anopheles aquasalis TaxID=42839 RepID=UPI00215B6CE4|nr:protein THEM6 [Anopheles aquasalis]
MFSCVLLVGLLILYAVWDVNYFLRCVVTLGYGMLFQRKRKVTEETSIYSMCTTQDVDIFIRHMNNARYLRELDFARFHFYGLTGIYGKIKAKRGGAVQGASSVRYRRTIPIFNAYKITTRLVWWDEKAIYLEQQFVTLSDGFVRAVALSKQCITNVDVIELMKEFPGAEQRPEKPAELQLWLDSIEMSSQKLRKDK